MMLSILRRAKAAGFITLVVTADTFPIDLHRHELDIAHLSFIAAGFRRANGHVRPGLHATDVRWRPRGGAPSIPARL